MGRLTEGSARSEVSWVKRRFADWAGGGKLGSIRQICFDLGIDIIAEGIEAEEEYAWLGSQGIHLFQGYLFAKPGFESLPPVHYSGP